MRLYDAHNHLQDEWLAPHLEQIGRQLSEIGLAGAVVNGTSPADWEAVALLARRFPWVYPSFGLHPWDAGNRSPDWFSRLQACLEATPGAAIGEIGLDRWILERARPDDPRLTGLRRAPLDEQIEVFTRQLWIAAQRNLPASIHCLDAWGALADLLRANDRPARGFLLHAYGGPAEMVAPFTGLGAYFSFNGNFLDPRKAQRLEVFKAIPPERLLIETDAPAMPLPQAWRTHKLPLSPDGNPVNHPANVEAAYLGLAAARGVSRESLAATVAENFVRLFGRA